MAQLEQDFLPGGKVSPVYLHDYKGDVLKYGQVYTIREVKSTVISLVEGDKENFFKKEYFSCLNNDFKFSFKMHDKVYFNYNNDLIWGFVRGVDVKRNSVTVSNGDNTYHLSIFRKDLIVQDRIYNTGDMVRIKIRSELLKNSDVHPAGVDSDILVLRNSSIYFNQRTLMNITGENLKIYDTEKSGQVLIIKYRGKTYKVPSWSVELLKPYSPKPKKEIGKGSKVSFIKQYNFAITENKQYEVLNVQTTSGGARRYAEIKDDNGELIYPMIKPNILKLEDKPYIKQNGKEVHKQIFEGVF